MNILTVFFHFPPISGGGVVVAVELINNFAKMGHSVTVITPEIKWDGPTYNPKIEKSVKVIRVKVPFENKIKVAARRCKGPLKNKIKEISEKTQFDLIFSIFHPFHLAPHAAIESAQELGIPSLIKIDDAIYQKTTGLKSIQRRIEKSINGKALRKASKLFVVNDSTRELVNSFYNVPLENISIIPNGVDISKFSHEEINKKIIVFSGAMYYHRGIDVLINAMPKIIAHFPTIKLSLIGDGPEMANLKNLVKEKHVEDNVDFEGWIDIEEIPKKLSYSIIGIGPLRETDVTQHALPIKVLEYMSASLPIVAAKNTLPKEILEDSKNGFFIDNSDDLASKIIHILENDQTRRNFGEKSRQMVEKYDWQKIVSKIIDEYNKTS